jgi:hypothetical protein
MRTYAYLCERTGSLALAIPLNPGAFNIRAHPTPGPPAKASASARPRATHSRPDAVFGADQSDSIVKEPFPARHSFFSDGGSAIVRDDGTATGQ